MFTEKSGKASTLQILRDPNNNSVRSVVPLCVHTTDRQTDTPCVVVAVSIFERLFGARSVYNVSATSVLCHSVTTQRRNEVNQHTESPSSPAGESQKGTAESCNDCGHELRSSIRAVTLILLSMCL